MTFLPALALPLPEPGFEVVCSGCEHADHSGRTCEEVVEIIGGPIERLGLRWEGTGPCGCPGAARGPSTAAVGPAFP